MLSPDKIDEWLKEVEERPSSAVLIIRYIANRLADLTSRNEELLNENIALRTNRKVEEYEARIATLEHQVEIMKRQFKGEVELPPEAAPQADTLSLLLYDLQGRLLRLELDPERLQSGAEVGKLSNLPNLQAPPEVLLTGSLEELLLVYDTGRTVSLPAASLPVQATPLDWEAAFLQETIGAESLVTLLPIARIALYEYVVQTTRRGFAKRLPGNFFASCVEKRFIGSGVKMKIDKTGALVLCNKDDQLVLATHQGYLVTLQVAKLPSAIEEVLKLANNDHIAASFALRKQPSLLVVTSNAKAIYREAIWLEAAATFKTSGQSIIPASRREAGVRLISAAAVGPEDWGAALWSDGLLTLHKAADLFASGSLGNREADVLSFIVLAANL
jgi:DNA gyrase/topoisomerase IV subunit A